MTLGLVKAEITTPRQHIVKAKVKKRIFNATYVRVASSNGIKYMTTHGNRR